MNIRAEPRATQVATFRPAPSSAARRGPPERWTSRGVAGEGSEGRPIRPNRPPFVQNKPLHRINHYIKSPQVRLIGADGEQVGVVTLKEAMTRANEAGLDLVEVAPTAEPPVCKIEDYRKVLYEKKRKERLAKKKHKTIELKEIKVRPKIDPHDFEIKINRALEFLADGNKVKVSIVFMGREIAMANERAGLMRQRVLAAIGTAAEEESFTRVSPRQATIILAPKSGKGGGSSKKGDSAAAAAPVPRAAAVPAPPPAEAMAPVLTAVAVPEPSASENEPATPIG